MKTMLTITSRFANVLLRLEALVALFLMIACVGGTPFGIRTFTVVSGSMEPAVPVWSLAYIKPVDNPSALKNGDVIAFSTSSGLTILHRVVENDTSTHTLTTKGDANEAADAAACSYDQVCGVLVWSLPALGKVIYQIKEHRLFCVCLALISALLMLVFSRTETSLPKRRSPLKTPDFPNNLAAVSPAQRQPCATSSTSATRSWADVPVPRRKKAARTKKGQHYEQKHRMGNVAR